VQAKVADASRAGRRQNISAGGGEAAHPPSVQTERLHITGFRNLKEDPENDAEFQWEAVTAGRIRWIGFAQVIRGQGTGFATKTGAELPQRGISRAFLQTTPILSMKENILLFSLALSLAGGLAVKSFAEGEKKEDSAIGKVMKDHFKGDTSDIKKAAKGELDKEKTAALLAAVKTLGPAKPQKGDAASWKEKTDALTAALEKLEKGDAKAGEAVKAAANCKACHDVHKGK
jgi:hypothetical protein